LHQLLPAERISDIFFNNCLEKSIFVTVKTTVHTQRIPFPFGADGKLKQDVRTVTPWRSISLPLTLMFKLQRCT